MCNGSRSDLETRNSEPGVKEAPHFCRAVASNQKLATGNCKWRYHAPMQRWLRITLKVFGAAVALLILFIAAVVWLFVARTYEPVGGGWYSARYVENFIADSGGKPRFLVRGHRPFFRHDVAENITHIQYLGDDCVAYTFGVGRGDDLYAACADSRPVFLVHLDDYWDVSINTDPLRLKDETISVSEIKRRAQ